MKLLFLYGPPSAGKLTTAREIAALAGMRVLPNEAATDLAGEVLTPGTPEWAELATLLRLGAIEAAAKAGTSMVFTTVYAAGEDDEMVAQIVKTVERHKGTVAFVQLLPDRATLQARVAKTSRKKSAKRPDWGVVARLLAAYDLETPIKGGLTVDNSAITAREAAQKIVARFRLDS